MKPIKKVSSKKVVKKAVKKTVTPKKRVAAKRIKSPISLKDLTGLPEGFKKEGTRKVVSEADKKAMRKRFATLIDSVIEDGGIIMVRALKGDDSSSYFNQVRTSDVYQLAYEATRNEAMCVTESANNAKGLFGQTVDEITEKLDCPECDAKINELVKELQGKGGIFAGVKAIRASSAKEAAEKIEAIIKGIRDKRKGK